MVLDYDSEKIDEIAFEVSSVINKGGIVIVPTDTVYGILADAFDINAIKRIYELKARERKKPLLILIKDIKYVKTFSDVKVPDVIERVVPGEVTFIMPLSNVLKEELSYYLTEGTVALRVPNDPFINAILKNTMPVVAPSANPSGHGVIYDGDELVEMYKDKVDLIVNKKVIEKKQPSTLYDCINNKVLREGSVRIQ